MSKIKWLALTAIAVVVLMGLSLAQGPSSSETPLKGTVKGPDGKPMEGVAVSMRLDGKTNMTQTVWTDRGGRYHFPPLGAPMQEGQYKIWAQAVGFETGWSAATLSAGKTAEQNVTLKTLQDFSRQLSAPEWIASLPEDTAEDRRAKRLFAVNCITCHGLGYVLQNRFDAAGWTTILNYMEKADYAGRLDKDDRVLLSYIHHYKGEIGKYLTKVRGPNSPPLKYKPLPRPTGEETQIVVTEYDVSPGHLPGYVAFDNGSDWSQGTPSHFESRANHDIMAEQHGGYVWFTDQITPKRTLGKLDPKTGKITDYRLEYQGRTHSTHDIDLDKKGNVWLTGPGGGFLKFDPKTEAFQNFPLPDSLRKTGIRGVGGRLSVDSKDNVWEGVGGKEIGMEDPKTGVKYALVKTDPQQPGGAMKLDPKTGEFTYYKAVTPAGRNYGVTIDAEDNAWFSQTGLDRIGRVDTRTGKASDVVLPPVDDGNVPYTAEDRDYNLKFESGTQEGPPWKNNPKRASADGNNVWHALSLGSRISKIDIHTSKVTIYRMPLPYSYPYKTEVDNNHMVWVASQSTDRLFKFNPFTEKWTVYPLPSRGTDIRYISVDKSTDPPTVWLPYWATNKIARVQFRTN